MRPLPINHLVVKTLGLDFGSARTGVAVSDATGMLARPVGVVEHVLEPQGLDRLVALGCDLGQGFLISRPLDEEGLQRWLAEEPAAGSLPPGS